MVARDFEARVVLVAGAGSGIGREAAQAFAPRGALVYGPDLNEQGLRETQQTITQAGGTARVARVDVSEEKEIATFLARISQEAGASTWRLTTQASQARLIESKIIQQTISTKCFVSICGVCF